MNQADASHIGWQTSQLHRYHSDKSLPRQDAAFITVPGKPIVAMDELSHAVLDLCGIYHCRPSGSALGPRIINPIQPSLP